MFSGELDEEELHQRFLVVVGHDLPGRTGDKTQLAALTFATRIKARWCRRDLLRHAPGAHMLGLHRRDGGNFLPPTGSSSLPARLSSDSACGRCGETPLKYPANGAKATECRRRDRDQIDDGRGQQILADDVRLSVLTRTLRSRGRRKGGNSRKKPARSPGRTREARNPTNKKTRSRTPIGSPAAGRSESSENSVDILMRQGI